MRPSHSRTRGRRGGRRRRNSSHASRLNFPSLSLSWINSFVLLATFWLKHWIIDLFRHRKARSRRIRREQIFVDASFHAGENGEKGSGGIGVWIPRRGIAIALQVDVATSMEAEILALLAGAIAAKRLKLKRPVIYSDCKSAVQTATRHLDLGRSRSLRRTLGALAKLASEHRAFRHVYNSMHGMRGTLEWQPRENNREADLASNIGSRLGHMGIQLSGAKNRNHALNDVLSRALSTEEEREETGHNLVHRRYNCGTRTVSLCSRRSTSSRSFLRDARGLIAKLSAEVA